MVSIGKLVNAIQAVHYFAEPAASPEAGYYAGPGEAPGQWGGRAAEVLGLEGAVRAEDLQAVLEGRHPGTGAPLGTSQASRRITAFDVTFSASKSISIVYALSDDTVRAEILRVFREGVDAGVAYLEDHAGWGRRYDRELHAAKPVPARLIAPRFIHHTSRPVTDPATCEVLVDPQLHCHVPIPNFVLRDDGTWGQLYSEPLYRHAAAAGAIAQAVWRDGLVRALGVEVVVQPNGTFEIAGISAAQRREFSQRRTQIEAMAEAEDVQTLRGLELAVLASRQSKRELAGMDLGEHWRTRAAAVGLTPEAIRGLLLRTAPPLERGFDVTLMEDIVGPRGLTAEAATFTRPELIRRLASHAPTGLSRAELEATADAILAESQVVVPLLPAQDAPVATRVATGGQAAARLRARWLGRAEEPRYSTPEMVGLERGMLATALAGRGGSAVVASPAAVADALAVRPRLTAEQRRLVTRVCEGRDAVILVEGVAGAGKTTALAAAREAFERSGVRVTGAALAGRAADELEQGAGISSRTVASLLREWGDGALAQGTAMVVDEAGMLPSRQLAELVRIAARDGTKLVLVGDSAQLQPIEAGAGFRALADHLGSVKLTQNMRQVEVWEREALADLRAGRGEKALEAYESHGRVVTSDNAWQRRAAAVETWRRTTAEGLDCLVVTRTRAEAERVNARARAVAVADGRVAGPLLKIEGRGIQAGDEVILGQNDRALGVTNGLRGVVTSVDVEGRVVSLRARSGREFELPVDRYAAIEHGYAMTVHRAQGATADVAVVIGGAETSEWAYTALSRARHSVEFHVVEERAVDRDGTGHWNPIVDDAHLRLAAALARSEAKDSTLDYVAAMSVDAIDATNMHDRDLSDDESGAVRARMARALLGWAPPDRAASTRPTASPPVPEHHIFPEPSRGMSPGM